MMIDLDDIDLDEIVEYILENGDHEKNKPTQDPGNTGRR